jgi:predicted RNase H-like HicB family nuclease
MAAEMNAKRYQVQVAHEGGTWLGDVPSLAGAHTFAGSLASLDHAMREVIALVEDLPEGAEPSLDLAWDFSGVSAEACDAAELARRRREHRQAGEEIARVTERTAAHLAEIGWSVRDIGFVLGISPGRVSQLLHTDRPPVMSGSR